MQPGRELDKTVARKVLGHKVVKTVWGKQRQYCHYTIGKPEYYDDQGSSEVFNPLPSYSTETMDAWILVEYLKKDGWILYFTISEGGGADVTIKCAAGARGRFSSDLLEGEVMTFPQAVCTAALKAYK